MAKTDEIDAKVIARTAAGMPWALRPVAEEGLGAASLRMLASQRRFAVRQRTQAKNRLGAVLLELDPAFEAAVDPSAVWQLAALSELGGSFGITHAETRGQQGPQEPPHILTQLADRNRSLFSRRCRNVAPGGRHIEALEAVARKRAKVIYSIMRDGGPTRSGPQHGSLATRSEGRPAAAGG